MGAFCGTVTKERVLEGLAEHRRLDEIVQGHYWAGVDVGGGEIVMKGCAVGCVLHDIAPGHESDHALWESLLGIPEELARLVDGIFEGLPLGEAKLWPERFIASVRPGAELGDVCRLFKIRVLTEQAVRQDELAAVQEKAIGEQWGVVAAIRGSAEAVRTVIAWLEAGSPEAGRAGAAESAWSAAGRAESAAGFAARSAWSAARSAWSAAWSAARSAAYRDMSVWLTDLCAGAQAVDQVVDVIRCDSCGDPAHVGTFCS